MSGVVVLPGLDTQQSIHSPATIHVNLQAVLLQKRYDLGGVMGIHKI
jgi:hypothetical protein